VEYRVFEILRLPFDAESLRFYEPAEQAKLWSALIGYCDRFTRHYFGENTFIELVLLLEKTASEESNRTGLLTLGEAISMDQSFPMLSDEGLNRFVSAIEGIIGTTGGERHPVALAVAASVLYETRLTGRNFPRIQDSSFRVAVEAEMASYAGWHTFADLKNDATRSIESSVRDFREQSSKLIIEEQNRQNSIRSGYIQLQERQNALTSEITDSQTKMNSAIASYQENYDVAASFVRQIDSKAREIDSELSTNQENLNAFRTAAYEALNIDSTRKLWDDRAKSNLKAFVLSAIAIGAFLLAIPTIALCNIDAVISALERVGEVTVKGLPQNLDGAQLTLVTISRLIVISLPIALYFWTVKLLVRFNMRCLILMDDASQRHTMMDTYFRLIEQDGATKADRALVLNALFRPLPGSASESVEPPNFTELIDRATGKG